MSYKLLVADDDAVTRHMLSSLAQKWGFEVITAIDGDDAWAKLHDKEPPQIVLLDWVMPGIDGIEICKRLRSEIRIDYIYVIVLTGKTASQDLIEALEAGADDFVSKPVKNNELRMRIRAGERVVETNERLHHVNRHLDALVDERTLQLQQAVKDAQQAAAVKASFLANMSHEIRTPLNGIVSYVELLLYSELSEAQKEDLVTIKGCVYSLKSMIDSVLDFSKLEADKMVLEQAPFGIEDVLHETMNILKLKFEERSIEVGLYVADEIPATVTGDRTRFQQIVTNLLGNAVKFCLPQGAVMIYLLPLPCAGDSVCVHLAIADTGIGIPTDKQGKLFESFSQADSSTTRQYGGTGLGLAISKGLVELMGGKIWFKSSPGVGTTFHVTLPFKPAAVKSPQAIRDASTEVPRTTPGTLKERGKGLRLLLAEDNEVNQEVVAEVLRHNGYKVDVASNGIEVLDKLATATFDLILMDIQMPEMGGEEATRIIRDSSAPTSSIPIVALTGDALGSNIDRFTQMGMNDCVSKPIKFDELFDVIEQAVGNRIAANEETTI